jgi:hypothetical protein
MDFNWAKEKATGEGGLCSSLWQDFAPFGAAMVGVD